MGQLTPAQSWQLSTSLVKPLGFEILPQATSPSDVRGGECPASHPPPKMMSKGEMHTVFAQETSGRSALILQQVAGSFISQCYRIGWEDTELQ